MSKSQNYQKLDNLSRFLSDSVNTLIETKNRFASSFEEKRTVCEVLEDHLSETEFHKATHYISVAKGGAVCKSITDALLSFDWSKTSEGRAYWSQVYSKFAD